MNTPVILMHSLLNVLVFLLAILTLPLLKLTAANVWGSHKSTSSKPQCEFESPSCFSWHCLSSLWGNAICVVIICLIVLCDICLCSSLVHMKTWSVFLIRRVLPNFSCLFLLSILTLPAAEIDCSNNFFTG